MGPTNQELLHQERLKRERSSKVGLNRECLKQEPLSVVIPVLNEVEALPANLRALLMDPCVDEIVVVDGGSSDGSQALVDRFPQVTLLHSAPGRGTQMNAGARHVCRQGGEGWLLFHHADSLLPAGAGGLIRSLEPGARWGGFRHRFNPSNWKLRLISALHNYRWRCSGVVYGDQSMFVRRDFFWQLGGFEEACLEDLTFSDRALRHSPSVLLPLAVETDARKFLQMGELRALWHVVSIIRRYEKSRTIGNKLFFEQYR